MSSDRIKDKKPPKGDRKKYHEDRKRLLEKSNNLQRLLQEKTAKIELEKKESNKENDTKMLNEMEAECSELRNEFESCQKESDELELMDIEESPLSTEEPEIKKESINDPSFLIANADPKNIRENSITYTEGSSQDPIIIDDNDPENLITVQGFQKKIGVGTDGVVVARQKIGQRQLVVIQYGPINSAKYRWESASEAPFFDDSNVPDLTRLENKPGEIKQWVVDRYDYIRTSRHVVAIQGVAFPEPNQGEYLLDRFDPDLKGKGDRYQNIKIKVKWKVDGITSKSWETRTTIRRLWGKKANAADRAIFIAAKDQEERYNK